MSMRILLTADPMIPVPPVLYGGIERIVDALLLALREAGHEVGLLAHPASTVVADALFPWAVTEPRSIADHLRNMLAFDRAARAFRPHLVHSFSRLAYLGRMLASHTPKLMSYQRLPTARTVATAQRLARGSLQFTGCSEFITTIGSQAGGHWSTVHNFVDRARFRFVPVVAHDAPLVFLSRLERIKGAHAAIEIARLAGRRLVIAGNRVDSAEGNAYFVEHIAPQLRANRVEYVGAVDDARKNALLGAAAAMLLPLEWDEPFGIVMAESLACGTPVIAYRRGAAAEIIRDGVDGFVVDDIAAAVEAVSGVVALRRADCRARVETCFDVGVIVRRYETIYRRMVQC